MQKTNITLDEFFTCGKVEYCMRAELRGRRVPIALISCLTSGLDNNRC